MSHQVIWKIERNIRNFDTSEDDGFFEKIKYQQYKVCAKVFVEKWINQTEQVLLVAFRSLLEMPVV